MSNATTETSACRSEEIVAYLDGELGAAETARVEAHLLDCQRCMAELRGQRRLLLELDLALSAEPTIEMPEDFARVVAVRARSDMRGMRDKSERRRALRLCAALLGLSLLLLGGAGLSSMVFEPVRVIWKCAVALFGFLGHALYDAGAGLVVLSRGLGGHLLFESRGRLALVLLLLALALFTLSRLIVRYHRARIIE